MTREELDGRRAAAGRSPLELDGVDFGGADLAGADLRNASLRHAKLGAARGLTAGQLAGSDLTGAELPPAISGFGSVERVGVCAKHGIDRMLAIIGACLYCWLTISTTKDAALITGQGQPLPIVATTVPLEGFYGIAPALLLVIFLYFHFDLQTMWETLAGLPAVFPDGRALHERVTPWLLINLVREHVPRLKHGVTPFSRLMTGLSSSLAWGLVLATVLLFWQRTLAYRHAALTAELVAVAALSIFAAVYFRSLARRTLGAGAPRWWSPRSPWAAGALAAAGLAAVSVAVFGATPSSRITAVVTRLGISPFLRLSAAELSHRGGTEGILAQVTPVEAPGADLRHAHAPRLFAPRCVLNSALMTGANLELADLRETKFLAADLTGAKLDGADLRGADLTSARLAGASLQGANLQNTQLAAASGLTKTQITAGRNWMLGRFDGATAKMLGLPAAHAGNIRARDLSGYDLSGQYLAGVDLTGFNLRGANLNMAILNDAKLGGADLRGATVADASFAGADLEGTDLRGVKLETAVFVTPAQIRKAVIR